MKNTNVLAEIMHDVVSNNLRTVVLAGHYCVSEDMAELSHQEASEEASFSYGASIVGGAKEYGLRSSLVLWVNDIGVNPDKRMMLKEGYKIPLNYQRILDKSGIDPASVMSYLKVLFVTRHQCFFASFTLVVLICFAKCPVQQKGWCAVCPAQFAALRPK